MNDNRWKITCYNTDCEYPYFVNDKIGFICNRTDNESKVCSYETCPIRVMNKYDFI